MTQTDAEQIALAFLMQDLTVPEEEQEWFTVLSARWIQEGWYVIDIGIEGLPDKWVLQVYDTEECDPNYTFLSPMAATTATTDLEDFPDAIADILRAERQQPAPPLSTH